MDEFNKVQANKIAKENNPDFIVENILAKVKEAAEKGEFECKIHSYGFGESRFYTLKEKDYPEQHKRVLRSLRELGFFADVRSEERQFVDLYLLVSWKD